jgi:hypothetical protein
MALLTAEYLGALLRCKRRWPLIAAVGVSCVPALAMLALWWWRLHTERTAADFFQAQAAAQLLFMGLIVMGIVAVAFALRGWRRCAIGCLAALAIPVQVELNLVGSQVEPFASARPMAQAILREFSGRPVFLYQDFESFAGLAWYLNRTVPVIDTRSSDLYYGHQRRPGHPSFVSEDQALHSVPGSLVLVMKERDSAFAASSLAAHAKLVRNIGRARLYRIQNGA